MFTKINRKDILIIQIYVDDIFFGATNEKYVQKLFKKHAKRIWNEYDWRSKLFLGQQVKQSKEGIFINQNKYIKHLLKKYDIGNVKPSSSPMITSIRLDKDENRKPTIMFTVCISAHF